MQIITDTASLYSPEEGKSLGITVIPACVILEGEAYRDYTDIDSETFLKKVKEGALVTSSQPAIGDIMEAFEACRDEILYLSLGDGLSGAYQNACGARNSVDDGERIHVIDTKTLAGPQHYLVQKAMKLRNEGFNIEKIKQELQKCIETSMSFVIPEDFEFLRRSGRLTPIAARIGSLIKIVPVLTQTEDKRRIQPLVIKRSGKKALEAILEHLKNKGVDEDYIISVAHAGACEKAKEALTQIKERFTNTKTELFQLSPTLITHGGPGCITIHAVHK